MATNNGTNGNINIQTGEKRLTINNDPNKVIVFNPTDINFAERFFSLIEEVESTLEEYRKKYELASANTGVKGSGMKENVPELLRINKEAAQFMRDKIDFVFGNGTSEKAFGDVLHPDVIIQFLDGVTPFVEAARSPKVQRYMAVQGTKPKGKRSRGK